MNSKKIYVNHIPASYDTDAINEMFSSYGKILKVDYPVDKKTKQTKGYAFITFNDSASAQNALEKNDVELEEKKLIVEIAIEKTPEKSEKKKG
ncbi:MAG: RNA-binding protein [Gammaproteobacteria bacterium]|nr:RNA-binding protein [Gammaproteobacteria bacterium]